MNSVLNLMPIFFTAFLQARDGRKWGKRILENGKGTQKTFSVLRNNFVANCIDCLLENPIKM